MHIILWVGISVYIIWSPLLNNNSSISLDLFCLVLSLMYEYVTLNIPSNRSLNEYFHIVNWMYDRYYVAQLTSGSHWLMTNFILIEHLLHPFGSSLVSTILLSTSCVYLSWIPYGRESMQQLFWKWLISFIMLLSNITHVTIRISIF